MANTFKWCQQDIKDEIGTTFEFLTQRAGKMDSSTITAYVSLLYNLVSCVNDQTFRLDWNYRLLKFKERFDISTYLF